MTPLRSFRVRLFVASLLWTIGLLAVASVVAAALVHRHPELVGIVHSSMISIVAFACIAAGLTQLRSGLSPFKELRERLAAVREGRDRRLEGHYPTEVQPLVNDLNALLEDREQRVRRALAKAGDLAHGLKTPLTVLSQEAERAQAAGHHEVATAIAQQVERMRRQVEYHLAHARAAASGARSGARCSVIASAEGLSRTLRRLYAGRGTVIDVNVSPDHWVRGQREDLDEMLGNLLDNACKWAHTRVVVESSESAADLSITVDDDGPGLDASMRDVVLQRGVRADEAAPGSGFGLAIVRDLAELYGGSISFADSPIGGLRARLQLPRC